MKRNKGLIIALIVIALILLGGGIFIYLQTTPEKIVGKVLKTTTNSAKNIISIDRPISLTESFKLESDISINYTMDETSELVDLKPLLDNISKIKTTAEIQQDLEKKELLAKINAKMNNTSLANIKYYLKDSTGYYYNDQITNKYINVGTNNLYENLKEQEETKENIDYVIDIMNQSLKKNITEKYIKTSTEKIKYDGKEVKANKISIELTNSDINNLIRSVIKDLKEDKKAKEIIKNYYEDFSKFKYENQDLIGKSKLYFNIYTTGIKANVIKMEGILDKDKIELEKTSDKLAKLTITKDDKSLYIVDINKESDTKYNLEIKDSNEKKIGYINYNNTNKEFIIELSILVDENRYEIHFNDKYKNVKKDSFNEEMTITFKYLCENSNELTLNLKCNNKVSLSPKINEDTTKSILEKSLTQEEKTKKENFFDTLLKKIVTGV